MRISRRTGLCLALVALWLLGTPSAWARKWTDSTGRFSLEAELVEFKAGQVRLRQANGHVLEVPLARLSAADRKYLKSIEESPDKPPNRPQPPVAWKVDEDAIRTELAKPTSFQFTATPLHDALEAISRQHGINIFLSICDLNDVGMTADQPVTGTAQRARLDESLHGLLKPLNLTWLVQDDVVVVTTEEEAEQDLQQVSYPVRDLVPRGNVDELIHAITSTVAPTTWAEVGGPGSIQAVPARGSLEVQQTQQIHQELTRLLTLLRQTLRR